MPNAYQAARENAAYYLIPTPGFLRLTDPDRSGFLQRQTTNDIRQMQLGTAQLSVLTSPVARILDVLLLTHQSESVDAITLPGRGAETYQFLRSRIFFNDKVKLADLSDTYAPILLIGPRLEAVITTLGVEPPMNGAVHSDYFGGVPFQLVEYPLWSDPAYLLIIPKEKLPQVAEALHQTDCQPINAATYDILRIENGVPGYTVELTETYTPLEIGLDTAISDNKGCYTGQEIIARQLTYDKVTRRMVGLKLSQPAEVGETISFEGKKIGSVSSVANSPTFGWIALAVVKRPFFEQNIEVSIGDDHNTGKAQITSLPF